MFTMAPFLLGAGASGAYYLRMHQVCENMSLDGLPLFPDPAPGRRILVLAPHCDDETLGAGSLIADARRAGVPVRVVFLTNGDAFPVAASRALRDVHVSPDDFVRFAEQRQGEALSALNVLGVPNKDILFLGYPDRGLKPMWEASWTADHTYRSPYTKHDHSPYPRNLTPGAPYCGASLVTDLERTMREFRPTEILVTHPADDHPDHSIAAAYAQAALRACRREKQIWADSAELRYYIVHRGDWPLPQGSHPDRELTPPPGLATIDTRWSVYPSSEEGRGAKQRALEKYVSQTSITGRFLRSFVRKNELFATLPETRDATATETIQAALAPITRKAGPTEVPDASGDNVARFADPAADITEVGVEPNGDALRFRLTLRGPASKRVHYRLQVRVNADAATGFSRFVTLEPRSVKGSDARTLEATVPMASLGLSAESPSNAWLWIAGETRWGSNLPVPVDKTGYRIFDLNSLR